MNITFNHGQESCSLAFEGAMTRRYLDDMEALIIDCLRRYPRLDVDLSGIAEIDLCGAHLLGVLHGFGDEAIHIVAASPVVEAALSRLPKIPVSRCNDNSDKVARSREHTSMRRGKPGAFPA